MKTEIQKTELYQQFKKALGINDMRTDDSPYIVECCKIAEDYAKLRLSAVMVELASPRCGSTNTAPSDKENDAGCYNCGFVWQDN